MGPLYRALVFLSAIIEKLSFAFKGWMKKAGFVVGGLVILLAVYFLGVTKGYYGRVSFNTYASVFKQELSRSQLGSADLDLLWTVTDVIDEKYLGEVDYLDMLYGTIKGAVASLGDPYTTFADPSENRQFFDDLDGLYEGIGIEMDVIEGRLVIVAPLKDSPAEEAGLISRDEILAINGESVGGMTVLDVINQIKGPSGTRVALTIGRAGQDKPMVIEVVRKLVRQKSVLIEFEDSVAVLTISRFASDTENLFKSAVNKVVAEGSKGLILDMRSNPGGFLDVGIKIANEFLSSGTIVEERFKDGQGVPFSADGSGKLTKLPVVVLVDRGSASAAEIVAGALQDNKRAKIVGEQTFGKGSVQEVEAFADGSALRLTVAKWYTPNGRSISDEGIKPDRVVAWDLESESDNQLEAARGVLETLMS